MASRGVLEFLSRSFRRYEGGSLLTWLDRYGNLVSGAVYVQSFR